MTMFVEPTQAFQSVADMRAAFAPRLSGRLTTPDLGRYTYNAALTTLAAVVADLPATFAAQLDVLAQSFVDAVADVVEADQVDIESEPVTRSYATSPSPADALGDRRSPPSAQSDAEVVPDSTDAEQDSDEVVLFDRPAAEMSPPQPAPSATDLFAEFRPDVPGQAPPSLFDQLLEAAETE